MSMILRAATVAMSVSILPEAKAQEYEGGGSPVVHSPAAGESQVPLESVPDLLESWATALRANWESVRTWQASYAVSEEKVYSGERLPEMLSNLGIQATPAADDFLMLRSAGNVRFALEAASDKLFTAYEAADSPSATWAGEERIMQDKPRFHRVAILRPEHMLLFDPDLNYGATADSQALFSDGGTGRVVFLEPRPAESPGGWGPVVDPREFCVCRRQWGEFSSVAEALRSGAYTGADGYAPKMFVTSGEGGDVYRFVEPVKVGNQLAFIEAVVVVADTPLVTFWRHRDADGSIVMENQWHHRLVDGVWICDMAARTVRDMAGGFTFARTYELQESRVNQPVDPDMFSIAALELKEGDRLLDKIKGIEYTHRGGSLQKATAAGMIEEETGALASEPAVAPADIALPAVARGGGPASGFQKRAFGIQWLAIPVFLVSAGVLLWPLCKRTFNFHRKFMR